MENRVLVSNAFIGAKHLPFAQYCRESNIIFIDQITSVDYVAYKAMNKCSSTDIKELKLYVEAILCGRIYIATDCSEKTNDEPCVFESTVALCSGNIDTSANTEARLASVDRKEKVVAKQTLSSSKNTMEHTVLPDNINLSSPIEILGLSVRCVNALKSAKVVNVSQIIKLDEKTLYKIKNLGVKSVTEIISMISKLRFRFEDVDEHTDNAALNNPVLSVSTEVKAIIEEMLISGVVPQIDSDSLSSNERNLLMSAIEGMDVIGQELAFEAYYSPDKTIPLIDMLEEFFTTAEKEKSLLCKYRLIPEHRIIHHLHYYMKAAIENGPLPKYSALESLTKELTTIAELQKIFSSVCRSNNLKMATESLLGFLASDYSEKLSNTISTVLASVKNAKGVYIVRQRSAGLTLQALADELCITRERIRQIDAKIIRQLSTKIEQIGFDPLMIVCAERNGDTFLSFDEVSDYYKDVDDNVVLMRILSDPDIFQNTTFVFNREMNAFVFAEAADDTVKVAQIVDGLPAFLSSKQAEQILNEACKTESVLHEMLEKGFNNKYKLTGNVYYKGRLSLVEIYKYVMEKFYPAGIKLYDEQEYTHLRSRISATFGDVKLPENNRAIDARIADISVLCDRGMYIHPCHICIEQSLVAEIFNYIRNSERIALSFNELFETFKDRLLKSSNVSNRYFLHGVLKYYRQDDLYFAKDYISKEKGAGLGAEIETFIQEKGVVHKAEIFTAFPGLTEIMLSMKANASENIVVLDNGRYMHADLLDIREADYSIKEMIWQDTQWIPISSRKLLDQLWTTHAEFLSRNDINDHSKLFGVVRYMFPDDFSFSRPFIARIGAEDLTNISVIKQYLSDYQDISLSDVLAICNENQLRFLSVRELIRGLNDEFLRIDADMLSRYDAATFNDRILLDTAEALDDLLTIRGCIAASKINDYMFFPETPFMWNAFLLRSIVERYLKDEIGLVDMPTTDTYAMNTILVDMALDVDSYEELLTLLLQREHQSEPFRSVKEAVKWLGQEGFYNGDPPKCLLDGSIIYTDEYGKIQIG